MKTLFIAPSVKQSASARAPDGIPRSISRNFGIYPWLGICYLAAYLRQHGFESEIVDIEAESLCLPQVLRRVSDYKPQIIGISTISFTFLYALRLAKEIRRHFDIPIVMGGPHVSIYPKEVVAHDAIDVGVIGEGEETMLELVKAFAGARCKGSLQKELAGIAGIAYRSNGEIIVTPPRMFIEDIDTIPFPAIDKLKIGRYYGCNIARPYLTMVTARGCPFRCSFCSKAHWGQKFRLHSAKRVVDEVEYYVNRFGIKGIDFYDDTFTVSRPRVQSMAELIRERNIKFEFGMMTRVDCVDSQMLAWLKEAGCKVVAYGVEFGDPLIQRQVNKVFPPETVKNAFRMADEAGMGTVGFFLVGHPEETEREINSTIRMIKELDADYVKANILIPYPGSELYSQLLESGRLTQDFWAEFTRGRVPPLKSLIKTKISLPKLIELRNYINRLPYLKAKQNNMFKIKKIKLFQDIRRTLGILAGSFFDRKV